MNMSTMMCYLMLKVVVSKKFPLPHSTVWACPGRGYVQRRESQFHRLIEGKWYKVTYLPKGDTRLDIWYDAELKPNYKQAVAK